MENQPRFDPTALGRLHASLGGVDAGLLPTAAREALAAARERLERDLLPRASGPRPQLVVGIVGPNNAGKSTLFNALCQRELSASSPRGGATRRLVGAAREPGDNSAFVVEPWDGADATAALAAVDDPARLLLAAAPGLPEDVLLVDTPDFDSVERGNRAVSEALVRVGDLALVVVTRHSYANREVSEFLARWLAHGRPWVLVFNEALDDSVTLEQADELSARVGSPPRAIFAAPADPAVAGGRAPLQPRALRGADGGLAGWLSDPARRDALKAEAMGSALAQLRDELAALRATLAGGEADALDRLREHARGLGEEVAAAAMPVDPLVEAFRRVLDRRQVGWQRFVRRPVTWARVATQKLLEPLRPASAREPEHVGSLRELELQQARQRWPGWFEELARLARPVLQDPDRLDATASAAGLARLGERLGDAGTELEDFTVICEELVAEELDRGRSEWAYQLAVDLAIALPAVGAGALIISTGGAGFDLAVAGVGTVSTLAVEKLSRLLGHGLARRARRRWRTLRGHEVGDAALAAALPATVEQLRARATTSATIEAALDHWSEEPA